MFRTQEVDNNIVKINANTFLKFSELDDPFYSKLQLYHKNQCVSDCSFKPDEKTKIKESLNDFNALMHVLRDMNKNIASDYLNEFIKLIDSFEPIETATKRLNSF